MLPRPTEKTLLVTHRGCLDGTGSALVYCWARRESPSACARNILFKAPNNVAITPDEVLGMDEVWFVDCAPPVDVDVTQGLPFRCIDHHISNSRRIKADDERFTFDMGMSGTSLFAKELGLSGGDASIIPHLEAYDLGRFDDELGMFLADLASTMSQSEMLEKIHFHGEEIFSRTEMRARVAGANRARQIYAERAAAKARYWNWDVTPHRVGIAVSPVDWKNEVANQILARPGTDIAVVVDVSGGMVSLRSLPGGPDCSVIAERFGGGGHARAAGFGLRTELMLKRLAGEIFE